MIPILSVEESKKLDELTQKIYNIDDLILMEHAGKSVAQFILEKFSNVENILAICGVGNNGGDGFVASRWLAHNGKNVKVLIAGNKAKLKGIALKNFEILKNFVDIDFIFEHEDFLDVLKKYLDEADIIIDAIFGTGFKGEPRDRYKEVIKAINQFKEKFGKVIISVDIPSGLEGDTGKAIECINADYTITFGYPKLGHFLFDGIKYCGNVFIKDIGFPKDIVYNNLKVKRFLIEEKDVVLPQRKRWFHKGKYGKVLVISGSLGFSGACSFVCNGAYKVGAGLVYAYVPKEINNVIDNLCPETVVFSPEIYDFENFVKFMNENAKNFNVIAMGPGLGRNELTKKMVNYVLDKFSDKKIVLDADAVYMSDKNILRGKKNVVITPHPGEFAHAFGYDISYLISNILRVVEGEVGGLGGGVIVAKGSPLTLISTVVNGEVYTYFNLEGNDGMATGGSGDVLTGIIAGLLAQGLSPLQASISGVFLHGRAGNMAMKKLNKYSVTASSILSFIPEAINSILNI